MLSPRRFLCNTDAAHAFDACSDTGSEFDCEEQIDGQVVSACSTARSSSTRSQSAQPVRPPESSNRTHAVLARAWGCWRLGHAEEGDAIAISPRAALGIHPGGGAFATRPHREAARGLLHQPLPVGALECDRQRLGQGAYTPYRDFRQLTLHAAGLGDPLAQRRALGAHVDRHAHVDGGDGLPLESCKTESLNTILRRAAKVKNKVVRQAVQLVEVDDPVGPSSRHPRRRPRLRSATSASG